MHLNSGHVLYTNGGEKSIGGVGFLINKNIKDRLVVFRGDRSRVASLIIKINAKYYLQVVQVYAPTSTHEDEEVEEFYKEVSKLMGENKSLYLMQKTLMQKWAVTSGEMEQWFGQYGYGDIMK